MREKDYVVIIGSANIDVAGYSHESLNYADSNPGKIKFTPGGVGRNIAQNLALLGNKAWLLSAVGSDFYGQSLLTQTNQSGASTGWAIGGTTGWTWNAWKSNTSQDQHSVLGLPVVSTAISETAFTTFSADCPVYTSGFPVGVQPTDDAETLELLASVGYTP